MRGMQDFKNLNDDYQSQHLTNHSLKNFEKSQLGKFVPHHKKNMENLYLFEKKKYL